ncbi:MAG TPA: hypothetical protein VMZ53_01600 [Kofleriaceae bacterium]|nr:hypothetical protein [Kofleriaceae bacterium]
MRLLLALVAMAGCGSVNDMPTKMDAAPQGDGHIDAVNTCTVHDQLASCGAQCAVCSTPSSDRMVATCDGTACGTACVGGAPRCTDMSCSRILFNFESDTQGTVLVSPSGLAVNRRTHNGSMALAFDFTSNLANTQLEFHVPVCVTGTVNQSAKTLKADVYFEGGADAGEQYYIQGSVPTPTAGNYLGTQGAAHNVTVAYSSAMSASAGSAAFNDITFRIGSFGGAFTGTVWVDNIRIE